MNGLEVQETKAQKNATRFGYMVAFFVTLCGCLCLIALWAVFNGTSLEILQTSWHLKNVGSLTTGTIVDFEEVPGNRPNSSSTYRIIVGFEVDGETYTVKSYSSYPLSQYNREETVQVIYDPSDPAVAQVDIFSERWFFPILDAILF